VADNHGRRPLRVFVGMETSGRVREAFRRLGHRAISCDLLPATDHEEHHVVGDVFEVIEVQADLFGPFDLAIFHPTCTYLTISAAWAFGDGPYHQRVKPGTLVGAARRAARRAALQDVRRLMALRGRCAKAVVIENPIGAISKAIRRPDQIIQPHQFGDDASKATCLWLDGVPPLAIDPTKRRAGRMVEWPRGSGRKVERWGNQTDSGQNRLTPSEQRWATRSETYPGIAEAFATQWGAPSSPLGL
jgi:hypothetical protein